MQYDLWQAQTIRDKITVRRFAFRVESSIMAALTLDKVYSRLCKGCNPVEVAGYGRESTHKGYLTWLLNTSHWPKAKDGLIRLVEAADEWPDDCHGKVIEWIQQCPNEFHCEYERRVGEGKVDLVVKAENSSKYDQLPIELKTDGKVGENQLSKLSSDPKLCIGLVLLLGSSAVRDDSIPEKAERGCFAPLTIGNILTAWKAMKSDMPRAGRDWLEALQHEQIRHNNAFDLSSEKRKRVYRDDKHMYYALLNSVRKVLSEEHDELSTWSLYDGGFNTVLNLQEDKWSWKEVAGGNAKAYWEFNDCELVLKVKQCRKEKITRDWVAKTQVKVQNLQPPCKVESRKPRKARAGSKWISVWRWKLPFDTASCVSERSVEIIRKIQPFVNQG